MRSGPWLFGVITIQPMCSAAFDELRVNMESERRMVDVFGVSARSTRLERTLLACEDASRLGAFPSGSPRSLQPP